MSNGNTSATGGYLDETRHMTFVELENLWHHALAGVTNTPNDLVRPTEQDNPPPTPGRMVNWIAFHIAVEYPVDLPLVSHVSSGDGYDNVIDYITERVIVTTIGPDAYDIADTLRRAFHVEQNRAYLRKAGIAITGTGAPARAPVLQNEEWMKKAQVIIYSTREAVGTYQVLNLLESAGAIFSSNNPSIPFDTRSVANRSS